MQVVKGYRSDATESDVMNSDSGNLDAKANEIMSQFGYEAETEALREQLKQARLKLSRQRRELKRLNYVYNLLLHASFRNTWSKRGKGVEHTAVLREAGPVTDVNGVVMQD